MAVVAAKGRTRDAQMETMTATNSLVRRDYDLVRTQKYPESKLENLRELMEELESMKVRTETKEFDLRYQRGRCSLPPKNAECTDALTYHTAAGADGVSPAENPAHDMNVPNPIVTFLFLSGIIVCSVMGATKT